MKKNGTIMALLAFTLLGSYPIHAAYQPSPSISERLEKEYQSFKDAFACAREKGFTACTPAQKKRIVATGLAVIGILLALRYRGVRGASWWRGTRRKALIAQRVKEQREEEAREQQAEEQRQKPPEMEVGVSPETLLARVRRFFSQPEEEPTVEEEKDLALAKELAGQWEEEEEEEEELEKLSPRARKEEIP